MADGEHDEHGPRTTSTRHRLLVSVPALGDDNFDQGVVLVLEHDGDGALGLVLNRPSTTTVTEHLPLPAALVAGPAVFFVGGPVGVGGLSALGRRRIDAEPTHSTPLSGPLVVVDPAALIEGEVQGLDVVRLFTGYSGWAPGQLDAELEAGAWHVLDGLPDDVFCADPESLWRTVMRRQGGRLASQALFPEDVTAN